MSRGAERSHGSAGVGKRLKDEKVVIEDDSGPKDGGDAPLSFDNEQHVAMKLQRASHYFAQVKQHIGPNVQLMDGFINILREFREGHINHYEVVRRVAFLFSQDDDIVIALNQCLPAEYRIRVRKRADGSKWLECIGPGSPRVHPLRPALSIDEELGDKGEDHVDLSPRDIRYVEGNEEGEDHDSERYKKVIEFILLVKRTLSEDQFLAFTGALNRNHARTDLTSGAVYKIFNPILGKHAHLLEQVIGFLRREAARRTNVESNP